MVLPPDMDPRGPSRASRRPGPVRRRRRPLTVLATVLSACVLLASTIGYGLVTYYNSQITRIGISGIPGFQRPAASPDQAVNFLLVGSDTRSGANSSYNAASGSSSYVAGARSDTQLLVHVPPGNGKITVVSFPRDAYVQIPAYNGHPATHAKINSAFDEGGPDLLIATIERLTGMRIDHFMDIDFVGFKGMVNALGGLTVCVRTTRHDKDSGDYLTAGVHKINGTQALAFVRDRHTFTLQDLYRIKDQQYFLATMLKKVESAGTLTNPIALNNFLSALSKSVTVDSSLSLAAMKNFAERMRTLDAAHVTFVTLPYSDPNAYVPGVGSVVQLDRAKDAALFAALRNDTTPPTAAKPKTSAKPKPSATTLPPGQVTVRVLNGTTISGLAHRASVELSGQGFRVSGVGNAPSPAGTSSVVEYSPGAQAAARTVEAAVHGSVLQQVSGLGSSVDLILGSSFNGVSSVASATPTPSATPSPSNAIAAAGGNSAASLSCAP